MEVSRCPDQAVPEGKPMPEPRGQCLQSQIGSERHHPGTLTDLLDDLVDVFGSDPNAFTKESPGQFVQNLYRKDEIVLASNVLDKTDRLLVLG